jgi:competence protein ComEC
MIAQHWQPKYKIVKYFWELTTVSLAAQIITAPLCIHYFGIFPNYFLLSNYIACPISTLLIPLGMFTLIVCAMLPQFAFVMIFLLKWVVKIMNMFMQFIESIPFSVTKNLKLSIYEILFIYVGMFSLWYAFKNAKRSWVFVGLGSWICCCGIGMLKL